MKEKTREEMIRELHLFIDQASPEGLTSIGNALAHIRYAPLPSMDPVGDQLRAHDRKILNIEEDITKLDKVFADGMRMYHNIDNAMRNLQSTVKGLQQLTDTLTERIDALEKENGTHTEEPHKTTKRHS